MGMGFTLELGENTIELVFYWMNLKPEGEELYSETGSPRLVS